MLKELNTRGSGDLKWRGKGLWIANARAGTRSEIVFREREMDLDSGEAMEEDISKEKPRKIGSFWNNKIE